MQAGVGIERLAFHKEGADGVKGGLFFRFPQFVESFKDGPIQVAGAEIAPLVLQGLVPVYSAEFQIGGVGGFDQVEIVGVNEVQAVAQINDGTQNGGRGDFPAVIVLRPPQGAGIAVFPEVKAAAKPVMFVGTGNLPVLTGYEFEGGVTVASVIAENQGAGDHGGSAILGFDLSVGGIHAGGYQKTAGSLLGSGDLARRLPDVPDFAFHIRRLDALFDGGHGIIFTKIIYVQLPRTQGLFGGAKSNDFEVSIRGGVMEQIAFLPAAHGDGGKLIGRQQQAQTFCPFTKVSFLPGDSGRPRCFSTCRRNSSEVIERRADKIPLNCSRDRSGLTAGLWLWLRFTRHDHTSGLPGWQGGVSLVLPNIHADRQILILATLMAIGKTGVSSFWQSWRTL